MPRRAKGPRLYLRTGRIDPRTSKPRPDVYCIRDGSAEISTGCGPERAGEAERALAAYIADKWSPGAGERSGDPASVLVAEVLALYAQEKAPTLADPKATAARVAPLLAWWGEKTVADVKRSECQAYVRHRTSQRIKSAKAANARKVTDQGARRELEDLSAAITFWHGEHPLAVRPKVWLPEKPESPRDALTRDQASALLRASLGWRWSAAEGRWRRLSRSGRANRAHLRRFILIGLYTGSRPGVIPKILWAESPTQAWADLQSGTIYRRGRSERDQRTKRRPLVRLPDRLLAHMRRWERLDREAADEKRPLSTVVHHGGRPIAGRLRRAFESCVADAGLPPEITPHWLRHTCATWLMEGGASVWDAAAYAGMTTVTLEKNYGHHRPDHQGAARRALGRSRA